jgi:hypothetical protein
MKNIKELCVSHQAKEHKAFLFTVKNWNGFQKRNDKPILVYTLSNGSMIDTPRQKGYVVEKHHVQGAKRSKFHKNITLALQDYYSEVF